MKKTLLFCLFILLTMKLFAIELPFCGDVNYKPEVQTVLLYADGDQLKDPIIPLDNMMGRLTLSFDILNGDGDVLNYTFIHCTHDWQPTDIQRIQYASGFESDLIDDYAFSLNTVVDFVNYHLAFPNKDMHPLISGNYLLVVFEDDLREENIYFTRRFMVLDERASIGAVVPRYPDDLKLTDTHQQLDVKAVMNNIQASNVQQYTHLTIRQNGRWDNAAIGLQPTFVYPDRISFEHHPMTVFEAGNQFRRFNTSNFYFQSENLAHIWQTDDYYAIDISTCESRAHKPYISYEDTNGKKVIYIEDENKDNDTEADYAMVNFFLKWDAPLPTEDVYILGAISDWTFSERNKMIYNYHLHGYECSMLLKQGYYNFMFVTVDRNSYEVRSDITAGNFWETYNVYSLYFYYYNAVKGYDELIGYSTVNSH